jgi:mRNA-degrading endonuclease toxin of MazEF toxin-antitoxin module
MRRGEVRWGSPNVPGVQRKRRPFLIVSGDAFNVNERWTKVLVVHLTSVQRPGGPYDWEVTLPRRAANLPAPSVAKCGEVYTLFKTQLGELIGTLSRGQMEHVDQALHVALGLRC